MAQSKLTIGAFGDEVRSLHSRLRAVGVEVAENELERGFFGPATRTAVLKCQADRGLDGTGEFDEKTAAALERAPPMVVATSSAAGTETETRRVDLPEMARSSDLLGAAVPGAGPSGVEPPTAPIRSSPATAPPSPPAGAAQLKEGRSEAESLTLAEALRLGRPAGFVVEGYVRRAGIGDEPGKEAMQPIISPISSVDSGPQVAKSSGWASAATRPRPHPQRRIAQPPDRRRTCQAQRGTGEGASAVGPRQGNSASGDVPPVAGGIGRRPRRRCGGENGGAAQRDPQRAWRVRCRAWVGRPRNGSGCERQRRAGRRRPGP